MLLESPLNLDSTVLGERLAEARRERGLTQQDAADAIHVARTTITAIEKGTRKPRASELARLLLLYGRSVAEFARPAAPPESQPFIAQFRDFKGSSTSDSNWNADIQQFERLCRWYRALELESGFRQLAPLPPSYSAQFLSPAQAGEMMASGERNRLGMGDGPITDLWRLLEADVGLRIFSFPLNDAQIAGMFVYSDQLGACTALNANHPLERQRWTLAHLYAHALSNRFRAEISTLGSRVRLDRSEQIANAFAQHFLMPSTGVIKRFQTLQTETGGRVTPTEILQLSHLYGVSAESLTHRLEALRLIPIDSWDQLASAVFQPDASRQLSGIDGAKAGKARFPMRYIALCVRAYQAGKLSEGQLAERLIADRVEARRYIAEASEAAILSDAGELQHLVLDFDLDLAAHSRS